MAVGNFSFFAAAINKHQKALEKLKKEFVVEVSAINSHISNWLKDAPQRLSNELRLRNVSE